MDIMLWSWLAVMLCKTTPESFWLNVLRPLLSLMGDPD